MITKHQASKIQNFIFGKTQLVPSDTYYVGLSKTPITVEGTGLTEPSGGGYERVAIANNKTNWTTSTDGSILNKTRVEFNEAQVPWGTCTHIFVADAKIGGNILYVSELNIERNITAYSQLYFAPNGIEFNLKSA